MLLKKLKQKMLFCPKFLDHVYLFSTTSDNKVTSQILGISNIIFDTAQRSHRSQKEPAPLSNEYGMSTASSTWKWLSFTRARVPGMRSPATHGARPRIAVRPYGMDHHAVRDTRSSGSDRTKALLFGISSGISPAEIVVAETSALQGAHPQSTERRSPQPSKAPRLTPPSARQLYNDIQPSLQTSNPDFPVIIEHLINYISASHAYTTASRHSRVRQTIERHRRNDTLRRMFAVICSKGGVLWAQRLADHLIQTRIPTSPGVAVSFLRSQLAALPPLSDLQLKSGTPSQLSRITQLINTSLSLPIRISPQLFSLILQTHIRTGSSTSEVEKIIKECMTAEGCDTIAKWKPEAFDLMIRSYGRDGDKKAVWEWYTAFRESNVIRSSREGEMAAGNKMASISWPYQSILEVFAVDSDTGLYAITSDAPRLILSHMRKDQISPPIELANRLLAECASTRSVKTGVDLWCSIREGWRLDMDKGEVGGTSPDLNFWRLGFKLLGLPEGESQAGRISLRSVVKDLMKVEEIRKARFVSLRRDNEEKLRNCFKELLRTAPRTTYQDFPLVLYILGLMRSLHVEVTAEIIDVVLRGILDHALIRKRPVDWIRHVCGDEQVNIWRARQIKLMAPGMENRNSVVKRVKLHLGKRLLMGKERKVVDWEVLGRRVRDMEKDLAEETGTTRLLQDIQFPLTTPQATLERRTELDRSQWSSTSSSMHDATAEHSKEAISRIVDVLERLVAKCVVAQVRERVKIGEVVTRRQMTDEEIIRRELHRVHDDFGR